MTRNQAVFLILHKAACLHSKDATNTNGVHPPTFPTGGACVLSVIRFQDGGRRSAVISAEARK